MDELTRKMLKAGICPHCYKLIGETEGAKWVVIKDTAKGVFTHFLLSDLMEEIDSETHGTITCKDAVPPELDNDDFYWICSACYDALKEEIKRKNGPDPDIPPDENWISDLDDWR